MAGGRPGGRGAVWILAGTPWREIEMKITIKETGDIKELRLVDPDTGVDWIADFVGNTGTLDDGQFEADDDGYTASRETYEWWEGVVATRQSNDNRIHALEQEHGDEAVRKVVDVGSMDLDDETNAIAQALDEAFGEDA